MPTEIGRFHSATGVASYNAEFPDTLTLPEAPEEDYCHEDESLDDRFCIDFMGGGKHRRGGKRLDGNGAG
jgi:hypothetical protein